MSRCARDVASALRTLKWAEAAVGSEGRGTVGLAAGSRRAMSNWAVLKARLGGGAPGQRGPEGSIHRHEGFRIFHR